MTRRFRKLAAMMLAGSVMVALAAEPPAGQAAPVAGISWLAMGDSYAAGEGISGAGNSDWSGPKTEDGPDGACQRSNRAWAPQAYRQTSTQHEGSLRIARFQFVACSGAVAQNGADGTIPTDADGKQNNADAELAEAARFGFTPPYDLISLSFGGNDLGFADIIRGCLGSLTFSTIRAPVCDLSDAAARLEHVRANLKTLLDRLVGQYLTPGGHVLVLGYPLVLADPGHWILESLNILNPLNLDKRQLPYICNGINSVDGYRLRDLGTKLNRAIADVVDEINTNHNQGQLEGSNAQPVHFVDVAEGFEPHNLCSGGEEWLNGYATLYDFTRSSRYPPGSCSANIPASSYCRVVRSFHPNDLGQSYMSRLAANAIRSLDWSSCASDAQVASAARKVMEEGGVTVPPDAQFMVTKKTCEADYVATLIETNISDNAYLLFRRQGNALKFEAFGCGYTGESNESNRMALQKVSRELQKSLGCN